MLLSITIIVIKQSVDFIPCKYAIRKVLVATLGFIIVLYQSTRNCYTYLDNRMLDFYHCLHPRLMTRLNRMMDLRLLLKDIQFQLYKRKRWWLGRGNAED